ncbi:MAG: ABC transporter ATP-binding protein [Hadesarchaea archaeon]|nr:ABC transporter ATP-binding protein [Hadesarchaea archaeon]
MINIKDLSNEWGEFSLKDINLDIQRQEYFIILGPTGAGKTLLLELIAGFHTPDKGKIMINETDLTSVPPENRDVGFVYQDYSLFPHLSVRENIEFGIKLRENSKEKEDKVLEIMELLEIKDLQDRCPRSLSGGEKQKTALARALVLEPSVLLLDEPLSALDVPSQKRMREELKKIHQKTGVTTIHVTHNREEAAFLGDRIAVIDNGKIIQTGNPEQIFREPKTEFVANFTGAENIFKGESKAENGIARVNIGENVNLEAVSEKEGSVTAIIRPEDIIISNEPIQTSGRNLLKGEIIKASDQGSIIELKVNVGREFIVKITKKSYSDLSLNVGQEIYLAFKASAIHLI